MTAACDLLEAEIAIDRLEAELATELPPYMRAFAAAHAIDAAAPPAPPLLQRASTVNAVRQAMAHPLLEERARLIARLVFPAVIEDDRRVAAIRARATRGDGSSGDGLSWGDYLDLVAARDVVARERFDTSFIALMHDLHGLARSTTDLVATGGVWPGAIDGWHARGDATSNSEVEAIWHDIATSNRVTGTLRTQRADRARARTFVVEPKREVIVVLPQAIDTPAARFTVLHEFGHALVALLVGEVSRVIDEAVASFIARRMEEPGSPWFDERAVFARARRVEVARALDAIERGVSPMRPTERPPWALWHDPGAQAAYVDAEVIADTLGGSDLAASIASKMRR